MWSQDTTLTSLNCDVAMNVGPLPIATLSSTEIIDKVIIIISLLQGCKDETHMQLHVQKLNI